MKLIYIKKSRQQGLSEKKHGKEVKKRMCLLAGILIRRLDTNKKENEITELLNKINALINN
jgi:hypothetical protein